MLLCESWKFLYRYSVSTTRLSCERGVCASSPAQSREAVIAVWKMLTPPAGTVSLERGFLFCSEACAGIAGYGQSRRLTEREIIKLEAA